MEKRLKLSRDLLKDDGAIIISIDENEFAQLKLLCDDIFGEQNAVGVFIRKTKSSTNDASRFLNLQHEYALIYSKSNSFEFLGTPKETDKYKNPDNDPRGPWNSSDPSAKSGGPSTSFPIENPYTGQIDYPPTGRYWAFSKDSLEKYVQSGKIVFKKKKKSGERGFTFKTYLNELRNSHKPIDSLYFTNTEYMNQVATKEINKLQIQFDYPKPVGFIKDIILASTSKDDIILDFFAGTGTTGQAVIEANKESLGNRKFILCTNNENNICRDVTLKRLKQVNELENKKFSLKYLKLNYISISDKLFFEYADDLLEKIKPLIELENHIAINDNSRIDFVLNDDQLNKYTINDQNRDSILYVGHNVLIGNLHRQSFEDRNIEIRLIPDYYYIDSRG